MIRHRLYLLAAVACLKIRGWSGRGAEPAAMGNT